MTTHKHMIYLDHNATTPPSSDVLDRIISAPWANSHSIHNAGLEVAVLADQCANTIKDHINGQDGHIIWTSSGSEANRLALTVSGCEYGKHLFCSPVSHKSMLDIYPDTWTFATHGVGTIKLPDSIAPCARLISLPYVNNETGVIEDSSAVKSQYGKTLLHLDCVQALGKLKLDVVALEADLVSLSGHKVYGPKGIGCLWVKNFVAIDVPHQGTLNVPGVAGFAKAVSNIKVDAYAKHLKQMEELFLEKLDEYRVDYHINFPSAIRVPGTLSLCFHRVDADELAMKLGLRGIMLSTGSACKTEGNMSHVLRETWLSSEMIKSTVRISFGKENTSANVRTAAKVIAETLKE